MSCLFQNVVTLRRFIDSCLIVPVTLCQTESLRVEVYLAHTAWYSLPGESCSLRTLQVPASPDSLLTLRTKPCLTASSAEIPWLVLSDLHSVHGKSCLF